MKAPLPIAVFASGRGSNLQSILDATDDPAFPATVELVISDQADARALERARLSGVNAIHIAPGEKRARLSEEADTRLLHILAEKKVRLVALAGFMRILSGRFLREFFGQVINIHPSLLPSFPGLDAQDQAVRHGVRWSGCTVHFVDEGVDTGPIILQAAVPVKSDDTAVTLAARILPEEHRIYPEAIRLISTGEVTLVNGRLSWRQERGESL